MGESLDRSAAAFFQRIRAPKFTWAGTPRQTNFAFMSIWIVIFGAMMSTGFVTTAVMGKTHPGADPQFWAQACDAHRHNACTTWVGMLNTQCEQVSAGACLKMGQLTDAGRIVPREPESAGRGLGRACDLREPGACQTFVDFVARGGDTALTQACDHRDANSCFYLGTVLHAGKGLPQDDARALSVFGESCSYGYVRACGVLGDMYMEGQGTPVNAALALANYERSCAGKWGESCASAAILYHRGAAGAPDEPLSRKRFEQGCELGFQPACRYAGGSPLIDPTSP
jgi:TPR repeat protein